MRFFKLITIVFLLAFTGCADDTEQKPNNGSNNGFDVGEKPDATHDGGSDLGGNDLGGPDGGQSDMGGSDMGPSGTITFRLVNSSSEPIYTGLGGGETSCNPNPFVTVAGADAAPRLSQDCGFCVCGEDFCAVCDCALPSRDMAVIEPGESREFRWDKTFWDVGFQDGQSCQTARPAGFSSYIAEFCYSDAYDDERMILSRQLCESIAFDISDDEVTYTVTDEILPTNETEISIRNQSGQPIFVRPNPGQCHGTWFGLSLGDQALDLFDSCQTCNCSEGTECMPVCPAAPCPAPMRQDFELLAGESRTFVWDHTYWPTRDINGSVCEYPAYVEPGTSVNVEICFARQIDEQGTVADLVNEGCEQVQFTTSDDVVEYDVE